MGRFERPAQDRGRLTWPPGDRLADELDRLRREVSILGAALPCMRQQVSSHQVQVGEVLFGRRGKFH
jgi:hypothetical protein